jgi:hypothetical protein
VGEHPHTGLWIACEPLLGLYPHSHLGLHIEI